MSAVRALVGGAVALALAFVLLIVVILGGGAALQQAQASCGLTTIGGGTVPIEAGQTAHVRTIIGVAKGRGVPQKGWIVALAVALQESGLRNLSNPTYPESLAMTSEGSGSDHDSLGLFQQRPQSGWGSVQQLMTPVYEATAFFGGPDVPPGNPGLLDVPDWEALPVTVAGQRVQRSAYPDAYGKWEGQAAQLVAANADAPLIPAQRAAPGPAAPSPAAEGAGGFTGADGLCGLGGVALPTGATGTAAEVLTQAQRWVGTPYSWGGGTLDGPSRGFAQGASTVGFDCSSFTRYAFHHGAGVTLPRVSAQQYAATAGRTVVTGDPDLARLQPGDLLFWGGSAGSIHHVAIYVGGDRILHVPRTGDVVRYGSIGEFAGEVTTVRRLG